MMSEKDYEQQQLIDVFATFDEMIEIEVPTKAQLTSVMMEHESKHRKAIIKECMLFLFIACFVLVALMTILLETPIIFIVVQIGILCFLPFMYKLERHHQDEGELLS